MSDRYQNHLVLRGDKDLLRSLSLSAEDAQYDDPLGWVTGLREMLVISGEGDHPDFDPESSSFVVPPWSSGDGSYAVKFVTVYMDGVEEFVAALSRLPGITSVAFENFPLDGGEGDFERHRYENGQQVYRAVGSLFLRSRYDHYERETVTLGYVTLMEETVTTDPYSLPRRWVELNGEEYPWDAARAAAAALFDEELLGLLDEEYQAFSPAP